MLDGVPARNLLGSVGVLDALPDSRDTTDVARRAGGVYPQLVVVDALDDGLVENVEALLGRERAKHHEQGVACCAGVLAVELKCGHRLADQLEVLADQLTQLVGEFLGQTRHVRLASASHVDPEAFTSGLDEGEDLGSDDLAEVGLAHDAEDIEKLQLRVPSLGSSATGAHIFIITQSTQKSNALL